jgi:LytS/YehU family sensor histidine kinase
MCPDCMNTWSYFWRMEVIMLTIWFVMWYGNEFISHTIDRYVSWLDKPAKRFALGITGSVIFTVLAFVSLAILFKELFNVSIGYGLSTVWISIGVSLIILLFMQSKQFLYSWRELSIRQEKMRNEILVSRYEVLKNQVNPHFMFNGLNALSSLVYEDQDLAVKYIDQLSKVFRYVLQAGQKEVVTVGEEIETVNSYIFLQKIRFGDNLIVELDLDNVSEKYFLAPLVIQMLIENAIKHNEITSDNPLTVSLLIENEYLVVSNNLQLKNSDLHESTEMGLTNIKARYQSLSNNKVLIDETTTSFKVSIPLITKAI